MAKKTTGIKLPERTVSDFTWTENGPGFINCPGNLVINYDACGRDANKVFGRAIYKPDAPVVLVLEMGQPIQICQDIEQAKKYVVGHLKAAAEAYLGYRQ